MTGEFNSISSTPGVYGICSSLSLTNRFLLSCFSSFFIYIINLYINYSLNYSSAYFLTYSSFVTYIIFITSSLLIVCILYNFTFVIFTLTTSIVSMNIFYIILFNISKYISNMNNICSYSIPRRRRYTYKIYY